MAFSAKGVCHRPTVTGRRGMVASAHPLASVAGLRMLMAGGNAIDAAVATAAALNVSEPFMSGLGGIGYMHIYCAARDEHQILDYIGLTPAAAELERYDRPDKASVGPLSPIVPGACGGWLAALERYGSMDAATVFQPAIEYAEQGIGMTVTGSRFFDAAAPRLHATGAATYLHDGRAPRPGDVLVQADLGATYRAIAADGPEVFYRGAIADRIAAFMEETGGLNTGADLAGFEPAWLDPVDIDYRGFRVCVPPPPCQAVQYLLTLNIMEGFDVAEMSHNSADTLHTFLEAAKLAVVDRTEYAAIDEPPTAGLLSKSYAAQRRALIGDRARPVGGERYVAARTDDEVHAGDPYAWLNTECTTHFDAIDESGNAVSVTQSLGSSFGSGMVVPGTGLALNNFVNWFDLEPTSPNAIGPSKKNEMCMSPVQVFDDAGLRFLIGTPGSYGILQTTPQMIMNVIDHRMHIQAAIEALRVRATAGQRVIAETRIDADVLAELERRGHQLDLDGDWTAAVGGGQGIVVDADTSTFVGGADPRRDGYALGW